MAAPKVALRKLAELTPDPNNARQHDSDNVALIRGLIERFGWTNPMLVDVEADDLIVAGHGRRLAALSIYEAGGTIYLAPGKDRGGKALPKGQVPVLDCSGWTEDERKAIALGDNRSAETSTWDFDILTGQLEALSAVDFDIVGIGFDQSALNALAASGGAPRTPGELEDSTFRHSDQFAVIVRCADAAEQEQRFNRLRDEFGADNVKVVVV